MGRRQAQRHLIVMPPGHQVGVRVPKGGSSCASCVYSTRADGAQRCLNRYYRQYAGTDRFVDPKTGKRVPGDEFCCDFWERAY